MIKQNNNCKRFVREFANYVEKQAENNVNFSYYDIFRDVEKIMFHYMTDDFTVNDAMQKLLEISMKI